MPRLNAIDLQESEWEYAHLPPVVKTLQKMCKRGAMYNYLFAGIKWYVRKQTPRERGSSLHFPLLGLLVTKKMTINELATDTIRSISKTQNGMAFLRNLDFVKRDRRISVDRKMEYLYYATDKGKDAYQKWSITITKSE